MRSSAASGNVCPLWPHPRHERPADTLGVDLGRVAVLGYLPREIKVRSDEGGACLRGAMVRVHVEIDRRLFGGRLGGDVTRRSCSASLTRSRTKQTVPPAGSTAARTRMANPVATVNSGVNVNISEQSCLAASANTASQNCSRRSTKGSDPNGNIVVSMSTTT